MTKYCPNCNTENTLADKVPKFCSSCGEPFAGAQAQSIANDYSSRPVTQPTQQTKRLPARPIRREEPQTEELTFDDENSTTHAPYRESISSEDLCVVTLPKKQEEKLGSLAIDRNRPQSIIRPKSKNVSKKQFLKEWQNELVKKPSVEIGGGN